jgi:hydrogenase nickel incorporation protein HypA/HybF
MHEMSYCEGVLDAVMRRAKGRPVAAVGVRIGAIHRVVADAFQQSFELAAAGGPAAGARTEVVVIPVHGHCMDCRRDFDAPDPSPPCPACGSLDVATDGGDEVILEWLEYAGAAAESDIRTELVPPHTHSGSHIH